MDMRQAWSSAKILAIEPVQALTEAMNETYLP